MSSEVQAKWMNSLTLVTSALPLVFFLIQYSSALTSWLVTASMAFTSAACSRLEVGHQRIELCHGRRRKSGNFRKMRLGGQRLQPFDLDLETGFDQAELGKMLAQRIDLAGVAAVERGESGQGIEIHGNILFSKPAILPARRTPAPYAIIKVPKSENLR